MTEVTLSTKNQIVIPREARRAIGAKAGDKLIVIVRTGRLLVIQKPKSHRAAIQGLTKPACSGDYPEKERKSWE
jgi:AbrB family looped-hinge helix DNA binding protein